MTVYIVKEDSCTNGYNSNVIGVFLKLQDALKLRDEKVENWKEKNGKDECETKIMADNFITTIKSEKLYTWIWILKFEIEEECKNIFVVNSMVYRRPWDSYLKVFSDKKSATEFANKTAKFCSDACAIIDNPIIRDLYLKVTEEKVQ